MPGYFSRISPRRPQTLVGLRRRHADVDDRHVRAVRAHLQHQLVGVPGLADDLEAGVLEQAGDPLAEQHGVLGQHDAHRRLGRSLAALELVRQRLGDAAERREVRLEPVGDELVDLARAPRRPRSWCAPSVAKLERARPRPGRASRPRRGSDRRGRPP